MTAKLTLTDDSTNPPLNMTERSSAPSSPATNDIYLDDGTNTASRLPGFRRYDGSAWEDIGNVLALSVYNDSGSEIATEKVVYESGFDSGTDLVEVDLADQDAAGAEEAIGITQSAISNGASGIIVTRGIATYPTTGMSVGDRLYISTTAGSLTNTRPTTRNVQEFATVLKIGASGNGLILVNPTGLDEGLMPISTADVTNPPTDAELDSAFGTPATVGSGFTALLDDNGGDANVYFVASNGTSWWYTALTKAT